MNVKMALCRAGFHFVGKNLPQSSSPWSLGSRYVRNALVRGFADNVDKTANIERGADITSPHISLGARSGIGIDCWVQGPLTIGSDVMMGPQCRIYTRNHANADTTRPMLSQGFEPARHVTIEDDVWIGARVMIMPGTTVGRSSIIAAGAVVTKDVPPHSVVGGVPARVIRRRV